MTGSLDLFRTGFARIGDCAVPPLLLWLGFEVFFGGTQPFHLEAWWVGAAGTVTCLTMPGSRRPIPVAMLGYIALAMASSAALRWDLVSRSPDLAWWELFRPMSHLLAMLVFTLGVAHALRNPRRLACFAAALTAAIVVIAAQLLFDRIRTGFVYNEAGPSGMPTLAQWSGIHQVGVLFVIGAPLVMATVLAPPNWRSSLAAAVLAGGIMLVSFLNGSRSAIFSIAISVVLMLALRIWSAPGRWVRRLSAVALVAIPILLWYGFTHGTTSMRAINSLSAGRAPIWATAARIARDHPWLGVGPGNYLGALADGGYGARYLPQWGVLGFTPNHAHNEFLQVGAETGVPSLLCFLWMCGWMVHSCWSSAAHRQVRIVAFGVMFAIVAVLIRANYDSIMDGIIGADRISVLIWSLFGAAMALRGMTPVQRA